MYSPFPLHNRIVHLLFPNGGQWNLQTVLDIQVDNVAFLELLESKVEKTGYKA